MHTYFRLFPLMDCLYTNDDLSAGLCIVPAGKRKSIKTSLPFLFFPGWVKKLCIKNLNFRLITLIISQMRMQNKLNKNQYDPRKDVYLKAGWMDKSLRTSMMYENVMEEVADIVGYNPRGYFLDTDSRKHIRLYRMNGFDVVAEVEWQGCPHALMNYSADKVEALLKRIKEY